MERKKVPRVVEATDTYVIDPEDEVVECTRPCCQAAEQVPQHWGQWLRPPI
ncbi:hypothetical protein [Kitasatospora viridis]|uniref:Uncharacterized protein n=1 Tax=Kitasatospora viridis TaxID=281105 RepID=A0A561UNZ9_9ACTN|nr:hypothetical protein [Kitasatospora viridis]TWG01095.1 hypothetical protein FHX73_114982 [Kitasatospora viridis]